MGGNSILNRAKHSENTDEWYTDYKTVESEVSRYKEQFEGKTVLCNSDDPFESSFSKYFLMNFNELKLKRLICTSYSFSRIYEIINCENKLGVEQGYGMVIDEIPDKITRKMDDYYLANYIKKSAKIFKLKGNGDFRSKECIDYLKESDIVVTNPPFSKFSEMFSLLIKYKKKYLIIGNQNALLYKEIFPHIKNNLAWVGYHFGEMIFKVPSDSPFRKTRFWVDETGQKWRSIGNAMWLTNLSVNKENTELALKNRYKATQYPKYDNFEAIHVSRVSNIPLDYDGIMGVPLTYIKYHNENDFEIVGEANHGSDNEYDLFKPTVNGKAVYKRILIRRKYKRE
ncbi:adenine-specific methyltransferase EcoRI family protein [Lactococcus allomyrinae]|uniref:adenine-specific methyltransferase EcoRI family protein n=1 Tax=Lactococcus allomyrinae TaxID=2419773 RepID=UPI001F08DE76|nr:adenine-specific methyltransferase EcoRI family protein [Lactococcus allomyrinae]